MKKFKPVLVLLLIALLAASVYGWAEYHRKNKGTGALKPAFTISASELVKQFEKDENKANLLYNDKVISIAGNIAVITDNDSTTSVLLKDNANVLAGTSCFFEPQYSAEIKQWKPGQTVKIKGICTGILMDVVLVRCVPEK
jgi:hypothetical protein